MQPVFHNQPPRLSAWRLFVWCEPGVLRVHGTGLRIISSLPRRSLCAKAGFLVGQAPYHWLPHSSELAGKAEAPWRRRIEKISRFEIFRELPPEFPGVDSEWQNNYPKGTTQIESNNTYEKTNPKSN